MVRYSILNNLAVRFDFGSELLGQLSWYLPDLIFHLLKLSFGVFYLSIEFLILLVECLDRLLLLVTEGRWCLDSLYEPIHSLLRLCPDLKGLDKVFILEFMEGMHNSFYFSLALTLINLNSKLLILTRPLLLFLEYSIKWLVFGCKLGLSLFQITLKLFQVID